MKDVHKIQIMVINGHVVEYGKEDVMFLKKKCQKSAITIVTVADGFVVKRIMLFIALHVEGECLIKTSQLKTNLDSMERQAVLVCY